MRNQALFLSLCVGLVACGVNEQAELQNDVSAVQSALDSSATPNYAAGITDYRSMRETAVTLPAMGGSYVDPDFKTKIIRVTNAAQLSATSCVHSYSTVPAMNADSTRIMVACAGKAKLFTLDKTTDTTKYDRELLNGLPYSINWESVYWSSVNPNIAFALGSSGGRVTQILKIDVTRTDASRVTVFKDLTSLISGTTWALWQLTISQDDNVFSFHLRNGSTYYRTAAYIKSLDKVAIFGETAFDVDETAITKDGKKIVIMGKGANSYTMKVWDPWTGATLETITNLASNKVGGHYDIGAGLMVNADRYLTGVAVRPLSTMTAPKNAFLYKDAAGTANWSIADHMSMRNTNESFMVLSTYGSLNTAWPAFQHEIIVVKTDGTGFSRVAHHRSKQRADSYWSEPRAVVSRDGRYVVFTSDHNTAQNDVYILKLPVTETTTPAPAPEPTPTPTVEPIDTTLQAIPAAPNYAAGIMDLRVMRETAVARPAAGAAYIDPDFKTKIVRITDAAALGAAGCVHASATVPAMNLGSTRILVACDGVARLFSFDKVTDVPKLDGTLTNGLAYSISWESASWSGLYPNILFVLGNDAGGNATKLYRVDVSKTDASRFTLLKDFTASWAGTWTAKNLTRSEDDNVFAFQLVDASGVYYKAAAYIASTGKVATFPETFDAASLMADKAGKKVMVFGKGSYANVTKQWDPWTDAVSVTLTNTSANKTGGAYDVGTSTMVNSDRYLTGFATRSLTAMTTPRNVLQYKDTTGALNWNIADHVSMRSANETFFVASTYGAVNTGWPAFQHEIVLVKADGTGYSRIAHHRGMQRVAGAMSLPRAVVSRDAKYVVFTSDHNTTQNDVYLVKLP